MFGVCRLWQMRKANVGFAEWCFTPAPKSFRLPPTCTAFRCRSFGWHTNNRNSIFLKTQHKLSTATSGSLLVQPLQLLHYVTQLLVIRLKSNCIFCHLKG